MTTLAKNGDTSSIGTDDQITWFHVSAETGRMAGNDLWANGYWVQTAYDENTPGATYDTRDNANYLAQDTNADVSTFAKTRTDLKPGHYAIRTLSDGSLAVACNYGSRLPGRKNSLQVQNKGNGTTLKLLAKTGHIWQNAQFGVKVHFADESIPNRVKVEMQSTESAYRTTTLTTKPLDPAVGAGQSAIRYDPNGGDGDAFRKAGDPGTQATTPEAATFLRKGYAFAGWNTKADGTGVAYQAGADVAYPAEGRTLTLYAQWRPITYTIRFGGNGATSGMMADLTVAYDGKKTLPANRYARPGKAFAGWNTKADGSGAMYRNKAEVTNLASSQDDVVVLYAQWEDAMTAMPETGGTVGDRRFGKTIGGGACLLALIPALLARRRVRRNR